MKVNWRDLAVFFPAAIGGFLLVPRHVFFEGYAFLAWIYLPVFALTVTCLFKNILGRAKAAKSTGSSFLGIVSTAIGITALQACGLGMAACGSAIGIIFGLAVIPGVVAVFVRNHAPVLIFTSIVFQLIALYFLKCFHGLTDLHPEKGPEPDENDVSQRYRSGHKPTGERQERSN